MKRLTKLLTIVVTAAMVLPFVQGLPVFAASSDIKIDATHFPDKNFRAVISGRDYDKDGNGYLSVKERESVINVHCENSNVYSIQGIEYFPNLEGLWCLNNHISSWDLSGNPHLKGVWCSHNDFTSLDFSKNKELLWVYCYNCKLTSLNLSGNPDMAYVECNANPNLKSLDLSKNSKLENLFCSDCSLTSLNVSGCPLLCELDCFNNKLTSLNVTKNTKLKRLDVWNNPNLGYVNVTTLSELNYFNCAKTGTTKVDVTHNTKLQWLVCSYNDQLTSLDLSKNPELASLHLDCDWRLKSLDLSKNPKLYYLQAFGLRSISTLNISNNSRLIKAYKEGVYKDEPQLGECHSYTINYGGSGDPFDNLLHCLVVDNDVTIVTTGGTTKDVPDSVINTNDGHSNSETFATRAQAIQLLYELAGKPSASGKSRFTDVSTSATYAKAVKWGQDNNICFGYPNISSNTFCPNELITRQDFALMAHRFAGYKKLGTALDYGRTDWFEDFDEIDYYAWAPFTWAIQFNVLTTFENVNKCYPHGRMTVAELNYGANKIFNLDGAASYSSVVNGNGTPEGGQGTVYTNTTTPRPTATTKPTATPTKKPTATPTKKPTATPTKKPTATPTKKPTATPTPNPNTGNVSVGNDYKVPTAPRLNTTSGASVIYCAHVQYLGWQSYVYNGDTAGTEGRNFRMEALAINIDSPYDLGVRYRTHVQYLGWQDWVTNGKLAGTTGRGFRIEALQIELTGAAASKYDIYYRTYVEKQGWQSWVKNGQIAGTTGLGLRAEAIQIKLVPKGEASGSVTYDAHLAYTGWQSPVSDGGIAGTIDKHYRMEGLRINVNSTLGVGIEYRGHLQYYGWETKWSRDGALSGTTGKGIRMEAIQIRLTGLNANKYDIYYKCLIQDIGWTDWAKNGAACGSSGFGYKLEAVKIIIVPKGSPAPGSTARTYYQK